MAFKCADANPCGSTPNLRHAIARSSQHLLAFRREYCGKHTAIVASHHSQSLACIHIPDRRRGVLRSSKQLLAIKRELDGAHVARMALEYTQAI
eukprot:CAMPEP_0115744158 /NCGR_PEP_ID=MMETSP0272-20121206/91458_1 /TAXON_ID=71861 /ORGANISM="Scrippsiella trochoidea, Strain CCMP3099" /LENGTH=93 /DNA_ID=CAMNT_0003189021 /DNA_START=225 /DNA_END=503 /DNA_ORIENTATION=+